RLSCHSRDRGWTGASLLTQHAVIRAALFPRCDLPPTPRTRCSPGWGNRGFGSNGQAPLSTTPGVPKNPSRHVGERCSFSFTLGGLSRSPPRSSLRRKRGSFPRSWPSRRFGNAGLPRVRGESAFASLVSCRQWDLRIHGCLWPACSVVGVGDRVTTKDQSER